MMMAPMMSFANDGRFPIKPVALHWMACENKGEPEPTCSILP